MRRHLAAMLYALALASAACSADVESFESDVDDGTSQAAIVIQRQALATDTDHSAATAFAGFMELSSGVDPQLAMHAVGLQPALPELGQCRREGGPPLDQVATGSIELVDVGELRVTTAAGASELVRRAFPTVSDGLAGVMYTSRDLDGDTWPPSSLYRVHAGGTGRMPALDVAASAPAELDGVTVGGEPLAEVTSALASRPLDLTWTVGEPGDVIWVSLADVDGTTTVQCTFADDAGVGSVVPGPEVQPGPARLAVHRVREVPFDLDGGGEGTLRFDYSLSQHLELSR